MWDNSEAILYHESESRLRELSLWKRDERQKEHTETRLRKHTNLTNRGFK